MRRLLFFAFILITIDATAQTDNGAIAKYGEAEIAYQNGDYLSTVKALDETERMLGKSNVKILYLKIRGLQEIYKTDSKWSTELNESLDQFFQTVDRKNYPAEKLNQIEKVAADFTKFKAADLRSFEQAKMEETEAALSAHLSNFPATLLKSEVEKLRSDLLQKQKQLALEKNLKYKNELLAQAGKLRANATGKTIRGVTLLLAGMGFAAYAGMKGYNYFNKIKTDDNSNDYKNSGVTPDDLKEQYQTAAIVYGSSALVTTVVALPWSISSLKKASRKRKEADEIVTKAKSLEIGVSPLLSPFKANYGLSLTLNF